MRTQTWSLVVHLSEAGTDRWSITRTVLTKTGHSVPDLVVLETLQLRDLDYCCSEFSARVQMAAAARQDALPGV